MGSEGEETQKKLPVFKDIRRYYCEFCGVSRSKKSLLTSHLLTNHKDELNQKSLESDGKEEGTKSNTCEDCGASFAKPAHLKQHKLSHSLEYQVGRPPEKFLQVILVHAKFYLERPFSCPIDDCHSSYRRKDHLNRHILQHQGKLFQCPAENCGHKFAFQGNMKRHVHEFHDEESSSSGSNSSKQHVCPEDGCGKVFKYASHLQKHEASHVKLKTVEVFCSEPGCMKPFTNEECLKAHIDSCHRYINCDICGNKQLKKNIKRHIRTHEVVGSSERIGCSFKGCIHTFSNRSNLQQHIKAVHLALRPFACSILGCDMRFSFKHVRDNHEKSACHVYTHGDFEETDEQFRSIPRGGQKRKCPGVEALMRKRVLPPHQSDSLHNEGYEILSWMLSAEDDDQE